MKLPEITFYQTLFSPQPAAQFAWLVLFLILVFAKLHLLAICILVLYIVGELWVLVEQYGNVRNYHTGADKNKTKQLGNKDRSEDINKIAFQIEGPVENYQDNTYEHHNMDVCMTQITNCIDIQGTLTDVPGYELQLG